MAIDEDSGRYSYDGLDRLMHEKARLSIMASLYTWKKGYNFNELKKMCNLTDGNLSRHISILKDAGLVEVIKGYEKNKPNTKCKLTETGRMRFREYLNELEKIIKDASAESRFSELLDERRGVSHA